MKTVFVLALALLSYLVIGSIPASASQDGDESLKQATAHSVCSYIFYLRKEQADPVIALQYERARVGAAAIASNHLYNFTEKLEVGPLTQQEAYSVGVQLGRKAVNTYESWTDKDKGAMADTCMEHINDYIDASFEGKGI